MNPQATIFSLHGFLGLPSDWNFLTPPTDLSVAIDPINIMRVLSPATGASMQQWAESFNHLVAQMPHTHLRILVGYSMGGRLALHCLIRNPSLWDAAVIISANPGLLQHERQARNVSDEKWAEAFQSKPWKPLVQLWESQPVFARKPLPFVRSEQDFRRRDLAGALRSWSTGRQPDLSTRVLELPMPLLWVAGEQDVRYAQTARTMKARFQARQRMGVENTEHFLSWIAPGAAHRVPWEQPQVFQEHFWGFLRQVLLKRT